MTMVMIIMAKMIKRGKAKRRKWTNKKNEHMEEKYGEDVYEDED